MLLFFTNDNNKSMNCKGFQNTPTNLGWCLKWEEDISQFSTSALNMEIDKTQESIISRINFTLTIDWEVFPVWLSPLFKNWLYRVQEKWIYPYFKSKNRFYYPWNDNPIGKYMLIFQDETTGQKIPRCLHQWVNWKYESIIFQQWKIDNNWCIRTAPEDSETIFNKITLWSTLKVK